MTVPARKGAAVGLQRRFKPNPSPTGSRGNSIGRRKCCPAGMLPSMCLEVFLQMVCVCLCDVKKASVTGQKQPLWLRREFMELPAWLPGCKNVSSDCPVYPSLAERLGHNRTNCRSEAGPDWSPWRERERRLFQTLPFDLTYFRNEQFFPIFHMVWRIQGVGWISLLSITSFTATEFQRRCQKIHFCIVLHRKLRFL